MSEVTENSGLPTVAAGNTVDTLQYVDRDAAAAATAGAPEPEASATGGEIVPDTSSVESEDPLDDENTFDVNRAEFNELRDLVLSLAHGINKYNTSAPHKIPLTSINEVLGIR